MKLVRESISFERYKNPKKALGLGGVNINKLFQQDHALVLKKWFDFVKNLKGKTVEGIMISYEENPVRGNIKNVKFTVKYTAVRTTSTNQTFGDNEKNPEKDTNLIIHLYDEKGISYELLNDEDIYIS